MSKLKKNQYGKNRSLCFRMFSSDTFANGLDETDPYKVIIEYRESGMPVTVYGCLDGVASVYLATGMGFIDGSEDFESIKEGAVNLIGGAVELLPKMTVVKYFPLPKEGNISYYVITANGDVYLYIGDRVRAEEKECPFYKLYYLSQYIIMEYRKALEYI